MRVAARLDELRVNSQPVADSLDVAFQKMRNAQLLPNLTRVPRVSAFVKVRGRATDDLQIGDSCEVRDYFILDAGCEKGVAAGAPRDVRRGDPRRGELTAS